MNNKRHGRRRTDLPRSNHDLLDWFARFAQQLKNAAVPVSKHKANKNNPMVALLSCDPEINPYYVTFALYWYCVPSRTVMERGQDEVHRALADLRPMPKRLRADAAALRRLVQFKFAPPLGAQLQELIRRRAPGFSESELHTVSTSLDRAASLLEKVQLILKDQSSGKRKLRNAYGTALWLHLTHKLGKQSAGSFLSILLDCAHAAFQQRAPLPHWQAIEMAARRYKSRFPNDYEKRLGEATRSRQLLTPKEAAWWQGLNKTECQCIVDALLPRFHHELSRL